MDLHVLIHVEIRMRLRSEQQTDDSGYELLCLFYRLRKDYSQFRLFYWNDGVKTSFRITVIWERNKQLHGAEHQFYTVKGNQSKNTFCLHNALVWRFGSGWDGPVGPPEALEGLVLMRVQSPVFLSHVILWDDSLSVLMDRYQQLCC